MSAWTLVTGATGGIGREFSMQLAQQGQNLMLVGRNYDAVYELARTLHDELGIETYAIAKDLSQPNAVEELVAEVQRTGYEIETLINNAGFGYDCAFIESDLTRQSALLQVNCLALMQLCYEFAILMVERGHGSILNVASIAGFMPGPYMATYYASKAFVQSFSNALHVELAGTGVHVTTLCPGPVSTPFWVNANAAEIGLSKQAISKDAASVAHAGLVALKRNKMMCVPGVLPKLTVFGSRILPREFIALLAARMQEK